jgi:predicted nucleic acid-binding protein
VLVVLDANVLVSAAITPRGVARHIVQAGIEGRFDYVTCPKLLYEVADVLGRLEISRLLPSSAAAGRFVADVRGRARIEPDPSDVDHA